jgi:hypothetical protein
MYSENVYCRRGKQLLRSFRFLKSLSGTQRLSLVPGPVLHTHRVERRETKATRDSMPVDEFGREIPGRSSGGSSLDAPLQSGRGDHGENNDGYRLNHRSSLQTGICSGTCNYCH